MPRPADKVDVGREQDLGLLGTEEKEIKLGLVFISPDIWLIKVVTADSIL